MNPLWNMAGPRRLASEACELLQKGNNVHIRTRTPVNSRIVAESMPAFLNETMVSHTRVQAALHPNAPLSALAEACYLDQRTPVQTLQDLVRRCGKQLFLVHCETHAHTAEWTGVLRAHRSLLNSMDESERPNFLICGQVGATHDAHEQDDILRPLHWETALSKVDVEALALSFLPQSGAHGTMRRILGRTVAEVAHSDICLAREICRLPVAGICSPYELVRSWTSHPMADKEVVADDCWLDGEQSPHPCSALAQATDPREHMRRWVWRAQAAVLLPWVDLHRAKHLPKVTDLLKESGKCMIDPEELEVGELCYLLRPFRQRCKELNLFERLRTIRNKMAHHVPMPYPELRDSITYVEQYS